jgi:hypothetical protein
MIIRFSRRVAGLLTLGVLLAFSASAQQPAPPAPGNPPNLNKTNIVPGEYQTYFAFDHRYQGVQGTPYLMKGWTPANVVLADKRFVENVPARYDAYRRYLIIQPNGGKDSLWLDASRVSEFSFAPVVPGQPSRVFRVFAEAPDASQRSAYVEVLHQGPGYALLKLPRKNLIKANYEAAFSADRRFDEFIDRTTYFLRRPDGSVVETKLSRKALISAAPALQAELNAVKADVKTEQDAVSLLGNVDKAK